MKTLQERRELSRELSDHTLSKKHLKEALARIARLEREQQALLGVHRNISSFSIKPKYSSHTSEATAIAIASDWHVGEIVESKTVNHLNAYNPEIAKKRAVMFFQRVVRLIKKERQDVKIDTLVLGLLGDFITGNIHDECIETNAMRPIEETLFAQELIVSGIEFLLSQTNLQLVIPMTPGNHSRITLKVHAATEHGNSLEYFMYNSIAKHFAHESRVRFLLGEAYHSYVDVYGAQLRFSHGHACRYGGGVGGLHVPLMKAIHTWNVTRRAEQDFMGHFHSYTLHRRFTVNGSLIGYSAYASRLPGVEFEPPQQAFCLWDKKRGKTVQIPILFA